LISSGLIDSFHLVDLSLFVEEKFGARIDDSELNKDTSTPSPTHGIIKTGRV